MEAILGSTLKIRTLRVLRRHPTREFTTRELAREGIEYAALFGSAARGELGPESDVDLLIVSRTPKAIDDVIGDLMEDTRRLFGRPLSPLVLDPAGVPQGPVLWPRGEHATGGHPPVREERAAMSTRSVERTRYGVFLERRLCPSGQHAPYTSREP